MLILRLCLSRLPTASMLCGFGVQSPSSICCFCMAVEETFGHLFWGCDKVEHA